MCEGGGLRGRGESLTALVETSGSVEVVEGHVRRYFRSVNGVAETVILQAWQGQRKGGGGGYGNQLVRERYGSIGMWGRRQVSPGERMILCREKTDVVGGSVGAGGVCPPRKDIRRW